MMHHDQLHIDAAVVRGMIDDQFPQFRQQPVEPLTTMGTVNAIFRIGSAAAARFPLRAADPLICAGTLRRETAAMAELAEHSPIAAPRPIGLGWPGPLYPMPWTVQTWVEGDIATSDGLSASEAFALDLANFIASLRAVSTSGRGFDSQGRGGNLPDHDNWMTMCFEKSERLLDVPRLRRSWAKLLALPRCAPDAMCHKDLIPANLVVKSGRLVGVLDTGGFGPADPSLDLVAAWHLLDRERREVLRSHLCSGTTEWKRGAAWAFEQAMGLVWYYRHSNPAMSALGRSTLRRILDDPDL